MATTKQLIDKMKLNADGWNRDGEKSLLEMLDEAQRILYEQEVYGTIAYKADGTLPNLTTTAGTQTYNVNATTLGLASGTKLWRVGMVCVKQPYSNTLESSLETDYNLLSNLKRPNNSFTLAGIIYDIIYHAVSVDNVDTSDPIINFGIDPGSTRTDYFVVAYKKAATLYSEAIQPDLPTRLHYSALLPAAMKLVEANENGTWIESLELLDRYAERAREFMNEGFQGETNVITRREA